MKILWALAVVALVAIPAASDAAITRTCFAEEFGWVT
jgi:hypothetical protein